MPEVRQSGPVLARLSLWTLPGRLGDCAEACERRLAPVLEKHGLRLSREEGRRTAEGVFSQLFEAKTPAWVEAVAADLRRDPVWQERLAELGRIPGMAVPDALPRWEFGIYRAPAGDGCSVRAGAGHSQGAWHSFGVRDGLPSPLICALLQDRTGILWLTTGFRVLQRGAAGLCRFDGAHFTTFTTRDGLADDQVWSLLEDRQGILWLATERGLSRYDGREFITFTVADGLGAASVWSVWEDEREMLWVATERGLSRYDGREFVTFTTQDGLADDRVRCVTTDREGCLWAGTYGGGLSRYDGQEFATFRWEDSSERNDVRALLTDGDGQLWAATMGGLGRYDGEGFAFLTRRTAWETTIPGACGRTRRDICGWAPGGAGCVDAT